MKTFLMMYVSVSNLFAIFGIRKIALLVAFNLTEVSKLFSSFSDLIYVIYVKMKTFLIKIDSYAIKSISEKYLTKLTISLSVSFH